MNIFLRRGRRVVVGVVMAALVAGYGCTHARAPAAKTVESQRVADAANAYLGLLRADQRTKAQVPFSRPPVATEARFVRTAMPMGKDGPRDGGADDGGKRGGPPGGERRGPPGGGPGAGGMDFIGERYGEAVWSNYPVSDVPRPGVQLGSLGADQRAAAMHLLETVLSPKGYQKVLEIMRADQALSETGTNYASGANVYTLAILGNPSATEPWMIELGGHHLGLNLVLAGACGALTPTLTGAQPAVYRVGDKTVRALAAENDKAFALLDALDPGQRKQAILGYEIRDLVLGPGQVGKAIVPEGLKGSEMTEKQRAMLLDLVSEWAGIIGDAYAGDRMKEIEVGLAETHFAWSGPTTRAANTNGAAYFRIQGPRVIIEFAPQGVGGDSTMHVHTVYRDPGNEYGTGVATR